MYTSISNPLCKSQSAEETLHSPGNYQEMLGHFCQRVITTLNDQDVQKQIENIFLDLAEKPGRTCS